MAKSVTANNAIHAKLLPFADGFAVAAAVSLPWSTSATAIFLVLWLLALIPTLHRIDIRRELATPSGGLPVLLFALGPLGVLWADVTLLDRWRGLDLFFKLLAIPLLFVQFRRFVHGDWVFAGYLLSCAALLGVTTVVMAFPSLGLSLLHFDNVLVKNAATQSGEFVTCIFGSLYLAQDRIARRRWLWVIGSAAIIFAMLADIFYHQPAGGPGYYTVLLGFVCGPECQSRWHRVAFGGAVVVGVIVWVSSPYLRQRTDAILTEIQIYEANNARTSSGERIEFWKKSIEFVRQSPVIGHGTGSIHSLFEKAVAGQTGTAGVAASNPHNQTLAVAIQLGLIGVIVLWLMWAAHCFCFEAIAWRGG